MKRVAKWLGIGVGGLLAVIVLVVSGFYTRGRVIAGGESDIPGTPVAVSAGDPALIARGEHLVEHISQCTGCHMPDLAGGEFIDAMPFAVLPAPNLTGGQGGVGAAYDAEKLERAIRHGVAADGRPLFIMPSHQYAHMSDTDMASVIAYLMTRPAIDREVGERRIGPIGGVLMGLGQLKGAPAMIDHDAVGGDAPPEGATPAYGAYLVDIAVCADCHGAELTGMVAEPNGPPGGPPLRGVGAPSTWTLEQFRHALREGERPDGRRLDAEHMPWPKYGRMTDVELEAIWQHLRTDAERLVEAVLRDADPDDAAAVLWLNNKCVPALSAVDLAAMRWFLDTCPYFRIVAVDERRAPRAGTLETNGDAPRAADAGRTNADGPVVETVPEHSNLAGFLIAMTPEVPYGSGNFEWFKQRGHDFVYIDRIAVSPWFRKRGIAARLYADIEKYARGHGAARLTCEVNVRPRNDTSLAFHERMGFVGLEERETDYGPRVLMMEKIL